MGLKKVLSNELYHISVSAGNMDTADTGNTYVYNEKTTFKNFDYNT